MLRVVCGQCGKKLEIPDAWAHNVVKCPQCREPIDLQERDSAECAVKLGQFLNENLGGSGAAGDKSGPTARPPAPPIPPGPLDVAWRHVQAFVRRHTVVVAIGGLALLLIVLDTLWLHTGTITAGALAGVIAAIAAWKSEMRQRLPSAAARAEVEYKVAIGLIALLGLRLAYFCYSEISAIVAADDLASVAPVLALLPKWGAILAVLLVGAVPMGAAVGSLPLVQRFSIYHVVAGGLVAVSLVYGAVEVVSQQVAGAGISQFVRKQFASGGGKEQVTWAGKPGGGAVANNANPGTEASPGTGENHVNPNAAPIETVAQATVPVVTAPVVVPWTAQPDPFPGAPPKIGQRLPSIHFGTQPWNPVEPAVPSSWVAVGDNRLEQSVRQLWDLSRNMRLGELAGVIEFTEPVALSADEPLIAGFIQSGMLVEVWSLAEGQMVGRLACQGIAGGAHPYVAFLAPEVLLMVYARGTGPQTPPMCQVWNFMQGEMLTEFEATGASGDPKTQWALSPGRKYLAATDKSSLRLYDLNEKRLVGEASVPSVPTTSNLECAGIAFAPDGKQITAIFRGDKKSHLLTWGMSDGKVLADGEFNMDLARGAPTDCRPLEPLPGGAGWVAFERIVIPPISGQQFRAWTVVQPTTSGTHLPRLAKVLDSARLLVIADDALRIVKLPALKQRAPNELLTLSQLLTGGAPPPVRRVGANQRPMPGAGQSADGGVPERISRAYTREAYIDFLTADDERINEQVRWAPWAKRPVFGVRWGLGILPTNVPANLVEKQQIEPVTGAIGPTLVAALDERLDEGAFGAWPAGEDARLTRVGWLGIGNRVELALSARRQDFDVIAIVNVNWQKGAQRQITVRVADVVNGVVVFNSTTLKTGPGAVGPAAKGDSAEKWLADLLRQVDQKMTLQPLPELTAEDAKHAAERLVSAKRHDRAADLVELRTYQARQLIDEASAAGYYEQLLGDGMGEAYANGDAEERRQILEKVLPAE